MEQHCEHVEHLTSALVLLIGKFIDEVRCVGVSPPNQTQHDTNTNVDAENETTHHNLRTIGLEIEELSNDIDALFESSSASLWNTIPKICQNASSSSCIWKLTVDEMIVPLLKNLGRCYEFFDSLPTPKRQDNHKPKHHPRPPPGMLSIQNYTDIAILLECTVCISILPLLDRHVRPPLTYRLQCLPRSLRGRAPINAFHLASSQRSLPKDDNRTHSHREERRLEELMCSSILMGNLVLLDRFRPMLLPRHLTDVYAALLQTEHILDSNRHISEVSGTKYGSSFVSLKGILLNEDGSFMGDNPSLVARAFQDLLVEGRKGPVWLRKRSGALLNHLATTRLYAVIDVFVLSAPEDRSAAALRLSKALTLRQRKDDNGTCATASAGDDFFSLLAHQLLMVLDRSIENSNQKFEAATIQFLWMTLDRLPDNVVVRYFFKPFERTFWCKSDSNDESGGYEVSIHQNVRRIVKLLSTVPPGVDRSRFCRLVLLRPMRDIPLNLTRSGIHVTILGVLLRLSCAPVVIKDSAKLDALEAARLMVEFISLSEFMYSKGEKVHVDGTCVAIVALLYSLAPTDWDLAPMRFRFPTSTLVEQSSDETLSTTTSAVVSYLDESHPTEIESAVGDIQRIAEFTFRNVIAAKKKSAIENGTANGTSTTPLSRLPSLLLEFLLEVYLRLEDLVLADHPQGQNSLWLTAMTAIPILCESCPLESLIGGENGQFGLLRLFQTVFQSLSTFHENKESSSSTLSSLPTTFGRAEAIVSELVIRLPIGKQDQFPFIVNRESVSEFGPSLAGLLLNMLTCMLELGAHKRSPQEESDIDSLIPSLEALARVSSMRKVGVDYGLWTEISEAASHVLVLIALRKKDKNSLPRGLEEDTHEGILSQAQRDLQSTDPPIRARGVALLRQLLASEVELSENQLVEVRVMQEVSDVQREKEANGSNKDDIFVLLVGALADSESYVYLAAIHALAFMSSSLRVFPVIVEAISTGKLVISGEAHPLQPDQRVKLAEVAIAVLRRFPSVLHDYAASVFGMLLFRKTEIPPSNHGDTKEAPIINKTVNFFEGNDVLRGEDEINDWQEKKIRLNTGGPVFQVEEPALVRAAMITLATEAVLQADTVVSAPFCAGLMDCVINCLTFESVRPVRRSAALLAYSLYAAVVGEMETLHDSVSMGASNKCPLTMAMMEAGEEVLYRVLCRRRKNDSKRDPATVARCEEALSMREKAEQGGILAAGQIAVDRATRDNAFLVQLVASS